MPVWPVTIRMSTAAPPAIPIETARKTTISAKYTAALLRRRETSPIKYKPLCRKPHNCSHQLCGKNFICLEAVSEPVVGGLCEAGLAGSLPGSKTPATVFKLLLRSLLVDSELVVKAIIESTAGV